MHGRLTGSLLLLNFDAAVVLRPVSLQVVLRLLFLPIMPPTSINAQSGPKSGNAAAAGQNMTS